VVPLSKGERIKVDVDANEVDGICLNVTISPEIKKRGRSWINL